MPAKIINLESLDGGGKSTQINLIKNYLQKNDIKCAHIHFPFYGNNPSSAVISSYLRGEYGEIDKVDPIFVATIYALDRYLYLPTLIKQINNNDVIILDRYVFSNMAYQGAKYNIEARSKTMIDWINELEFEFMSLPYPNLTLFFDVPIEIIENRLKEKREGEDRQYLNGKNDIHESNIEFQKRVRENYLFLKNKYKNFIVVETESLSPEDLFNKYKPHLNKLLFNGK